MVGSIFVKGVAEQSLKESHFQKLLLPLGNCRRSWFNSSNKDDVDGAESDATPTSKTLGKAVDVSVQSLDDIVLGGCDGSSTKGPKIVPDSSAKGLKLVSDENAKGPKLVSDSNAMDEGSADDLIVTQTKNSLGKRAADSVVSVIDVDVGDSVASTAKEPKLVRVKVEVDE